MQTKNDTSTNQQVFSNSVKAKIDNRSVSPKVSVMIISYNQKDFVSEAIEGAINQDYENLEVVISDDGSTDGTAEIIAQWQLRYPERLVALLNKENVGITRNCNRALRACTGDFVAFIGGDDVMLPGKVTAQVDWFLQDQDRLLCGHQIDYISQDNSIIQISKQTLNEGVGPTIFVRCGAQLPAQSIMVRASAIPPHGFDESIPIASDLLFWIEVLYPSGKYGYVDGVYAQYRDHHTNVSKQYSKMLFDIERTYLIVADRYPQYRKVAMNSIIKHVIYFGGVRQLNLGNKLAAREKFLETIRKKPLFLKAWIRLLQTL